MLDPLVKIEPGISTRDAVLALAEVVEAVIGVLDNAPWQAHDRVIALMDALETKPEAK